MRLDEALTQIEQMRRVTAGAGMFRGYRSGVVLISSASAVVGAAAQAVWLPRPMESLAWYLTLWVGLAALNLMIAAVSIRRRCVSLLDRDMALVTVERFLPFVVAGAAITAVIALTAPASAWLLPGLWLTLFGLGMFASWRLLPRATFWVGGFYLVAGVACIGWGQDERALSPWLMGLPFGVGQAAAAGVLYMTLERSHGET